ncbi:MAG TPA: phosphoribosyltransferase family protein [Actinomycetes bacterium]|nr:phosphoribosyltransferase family protein [Actinomycetes bacterium]
MAVVDALHGWLQPASCLACGVPAAWPCCARCLPSEPGQVGPWRLAAAGIGADLVTWVAGRSAGRPRDHAEWIGAGVAAALGLPAVGLLAPAGGRDLGRARRALRPDRPPPSRPPPRPRRRLAGGRVLLVDDLATTGGTLGGAAAALRQAGARRVEAAVLAAAGTAIAGERAAPFPEAGPWPQP